MQLMKTNKKPIKKSTSMSSSKSVIGLSISPSAIRMVQISGKNPLQVQLEKYAIEYLAPNIVTGNEITDFDKLVSHLQQCYSKLKTNCKQINIALPFSSVTIEENLTFNPEASEVSLQDFIETEVLAFGPLEETSYDWDVLSEDPTTKEQTVLMVASKKENIDQYKDLTDELGVEVINVDVDIFAVANAFVFTDTIQSNELSHSRVAVVNIGDTSMQILIMQDGKILYKQESSIGLEQLLQLIRRNYQLPDEEALNIALGNTPRPEDYNDVVRDPFNLQITQEIQRTIQLFLTTQSMDSDSSVSRLAISGSGCIFDSQLENTVKQQTGIDTRQATPASLAINKTKQSNDQLAKDANALTIAFGLALRGLVTK